MRIPVQSLLVELHEVPVGGLLIDSSGDIGLAVMWAGQSPDVRDAAYMPLCGANAFTVCWVKPVPGANRVRVISMPECRSVISTDSIVTMTIGYIRETTPLAAQGDIVFIDEGPMVVAEHGSELVLVSLRDGSMNAAPNSHVLGSRHWGLVGYDGDLELFDTSR